MVKNYCSEEKHNISRIVYSLAFLIFMLFFDSLQIAYANHSTHINRNGGESLRNSIYLIPNNSYLDTEEPSDEDPPPIEPQGIIEPDDRIQVSDVHSFPYRMVLALIVSFPYSPNGKCTGWFAGPHTIVTAGHCIFDSDRGGWATKINIYFERNGNTTRVETYVTNSNQCSQTTSSCGPLRKASQWPGDESYDYGAIILPNDTVGNLSGWFIAEDASDLTLDNNYYQISGYPDPPDGGDWGTQWWHGDNLNSWNTTTLEYDIDATEGQSGAPVFYTSSQTFYSNGIHVREINNIFGTTLYNEATRINSSVLSDLRAWGASSSEQICWALYTDVVNGNDSSLTRTVQSGYECGDYINYTGNSNVRLDVTPPSGYGVVWESTDNDNSTAFNNTVTMNSRKDVTATYIKIPTGVSASDGYYTNKIEISWNSSPEATSYEVYRASSSTGSKTRITTTSGTLVSDSSTTPGAVYYYWVKACISAGCTDFSDYDSGYRGGSDPTIPTLLIPDDGSTTSDNTPYFEWSSVPGATMYNIEVSESSNFTNLVINSTTSNSYFTLSSGLTDDTYFWRVRARDANGTWSGWSSTWSFTIFTGSSCDTPGTPGLVAPGNGSLTDDNTPNFDWNSSSNANQYQLQVDNHSNFSSPEINTETASTNYIPASGLSESTYHWKVRGHNTSVGCDVYGLWSSTWTVTIDTTPTEIPVLSSPANGSTISDNTPYYDWNTVSGATQYNIEVDDDPEFGIVVYSAFPNESYYTNTIVLDDDTYYWRVTARDAAGNWGDESSVWSFTIDTSPPCDSPGIPELVSPSNQSLTIDNTPGFDWNSSSHTSQYQLQVDNHSNFSSPEVNTETSNTNFTPTPDLSDNTYYWRVRGHNTSEGCDVYGSWSSAWNLTIDTTPPEISILSTPTNGSTISDSTPNFDWSSPSGATQFHIEVDENSDFSSQVIDTSTSSSDYNPEISLNDNLYYWRVRARDAAGNWSGWSAVWTFTINTVPSCEIPGIPGLFAPGNGSLTDDSTPNFDWNSSSNASQYQLQVDNNSDFGSAEVDTETSSTDFTPTSGLSDNTYYWRVRGRNTSNGCDVYGPWSSAWTVTIDTTTTEVPILSSPTNGSTISDSTPFFDWSSVSGATQYNLEVDDDPEFAIVVFSVFPTNSDYTYDDGLDDGRYYWRVTARDAAGNWGDESSVWSFTIDTVDDEVVLIPAGDFLMGCNENIPGEICNSFELPLHTVYLGDYYIDKYEVTNSNYAECVNAGACNLPSNTGHYSDTNYLNHPVTYVTWDDAEDYCSWEGKRLPTEAEWEKGAKGTSGTRIYPWGNAEPTCSLLNMNGCVRNTTVVGSYPDGASLPYGLMDMAGNVVEWISDWYASDYYSSHPVDSWPSNPTGPPEGTLKIIRMGSFESGAQNNRSSLRQGTSPTTSHYDRGFRCAMSQPEMDVRWDNNDKSIVDGDTTPTSSDGTDFGSVILSEDPVIHTFRIHNTGNSDLILSGDPQVLLSGCSDFNVVSQPSSHVEPGSSKTFSIEFNPTSEGSCSSSLVIPNNDPNENPYNFTIQGTGTTSNEKYIVCFPLICK